MTLLLLLLLAGALRVGAADFSVNGLNYSVLSGNSVAIMPLDEGSYSGLTAANFTDSVTWEGKTYAVVGIYEQAFNKASFSGRITLPKPLTTISQFAFYAATGDGITLGENVQYVSANAFAGNKFTSGIFVDEANATFCNLTNSDGSNCNGLLASKDKKTLLNYPGGKTATSLAIPSFVTQVGDFCFYRNEGLASITIPNTVTRIGMAAFLECLDYSSITIPASVTELGESAFQGCVNATRLTFNTRSLEVIPAKAFFCCVSLKSITLPEGVKTLGESAFASCEQLTSFNLSSTVETVEASCFMGDPIRSIDLKNVKTLAFMSFGRCESLTTITGGSQLEFIDNAAFVRCDALTTLNFPEGVKTLFGNTFFRCASLRNLTLPASLQCIGVNPVTGCELLSNLQVAAGAQHFKVIDGALYATTGATVVGESVTDGDHDQPTVLVSVPSAISRRALNVPEGVTTLGAQSIREVELTRVTLPSTLTTIRQFAFGDVYNLSKLTCMAMTPPAGGDVENGDYIFTDEVFANATLLVPAAALEAYRNHSIWGRFSTINDIESEVVPVDSTTRFPYLVENDYTLYFRVIGDNEVEYIAPSDYDPDLGPYAGTFRWDTPETVEYNDKTYRVTTVGEGAFRNATLRGENQYTNLIWLNGVSTVKDEAFSGWQINWLGLNAITNLAPSALRGNKINRFSVFGGDYGHSPDNDHGNYNGNQMSGDIYKTVDGKKVLWAWGGDRRTNAWLNGNMSVTTGWTFNYDEIGDYALADNTNLQTVTIVGATRIGEQALAGMTALTTLTLPATLSQVGTDAFKGSDAIATITCNATVPPTGAVFDDAVYDRIRQSGDINVPASALDAYQADRNWRRFWFEDQPVVSGDLNDDGIVDVMDMNLAINAILNGSTDNLTGDADLNGDGSIDIEDVNAIINIILN